jgi:hypothetical protein
MHKEVYPKAFDKDVVMLKPFRSRLQVESLERRDCPSVTLTLQNGNTLVINGDNTNNDVQITQDDANDTLSVTAVFTAPLPSTGGSNGVLGKPPATLATQTFRSSQISHIVVKLGSGDDSLEYQLAPGSNYTFAKAFNINMGDGNNIVTFDTGNPQMGGDLTDGNTRPQMNNSQIQANLKLSICTGAGNDQVQVNLSEITNHAIVAVFAKTGAGDDSFSCVSDGTIHSGSALMIDGDGGLGNDTLYASVRGTVEKGAFVSISLRGGQGDDQITVDQNSLLLGRMSVSAWGGAGNDQITVNANSQAGSNGTLSVREFGDQGDDSLTYNALPATNAALNLVNALLAGGDGTDTAHISQTVPMSSIEIVDYLGNNPSKGGNPLPV